MQLFIDGDASPVKQDVIDLAERFGLTVQIVTSVDHYTTREYPAFVSMTYVDKGQDMADFKIVSMVHKGDILVTQDYGLASLILPKARVLHHTGWEYTATNIDQLLASRYHSSQLRKAGHRTKGPRPFSHEQRQAFRELLERMIKEELAKHQKQ